MQGAGVKQTRSVCSPRARAAAAGRSRCVFAKQIRGFSAQSLSPKQMRCLSNLSRPCAASTGSQTRGESNSVQGASVKKNASVTQTETRFPNGSSSGNCIPESTLGMGFIFRKTPQAESSSRNPRSERVALSQRRSKRKAHPRIRAQTGTHFPLHLPPRKTCAPSIPKLGRRRPKRNRRRSI